MFLNLKGASTLPIVLIIQFIVAGIVEVVGYILIKNKINNIELINIYTLVEFSLYNLFYLGYFKGHNTKVLFRLLFPVIGVTMIIDYLIYGTDRMGIISGILESIVFVSASLYLFYEVINHNTVQNFASSYFFWINTGILLYFSGSLLIITFDNYILTYYPKNHSIIWSTVHSFFNITYNILLSIGIWKTRRA